MMIFKLLVKEGILSLITS